MKKIILTGILLLGSLPAFASSNNCKDFSGVYFSKDSALESCHSIEQNSCESFKYTFYTPSGEPVDYLNFITDGVFRRYESQPSTQKAHKHNLDGTLLFAFVKDSGLNSRTISKLLSTGDIESNVTWDYPDGRHYSETYIKKRLTSPQECAKY